MPPVGSYRVTPGKTVNGTSVFQRWLDERVIKSRRNKPNNTSAAPRRLARRVGKGALAFPDDAEDASTR